MQNGTSDPASDKRRRPLKRPNRRALGEPTPHSGRFQTRATALDDSLLALMLALGLAVGLRFIDYAYDDAYITYRYARNLSLGHGLVFNLGQNFLGTTTPLYTLLLAGLSFLLPIPVASGLLSLGSLLSAILASEVLGRQTGIRFAGSLTGLFLLSEPEIFKIFGGETMLVYFMLLPSGLALHRAEYRRTAALLFAFAILGRMDAVTFVALVYSWDAFQNRRIPWTEGLWVGGILAPWFAYSLYAFGQLFPSTLATKMAMGESGAWKLFFAGSQPYLAALAPYRGELAPAFLALLALGLLRTLRTERVWLVFVGNSLLFALIYEWVLRSAFSHWYLASAYLLHALLLGAGIRETWTIAIGVTRRLGEPARRSAQAVLRAGVILMLGIWLLWGLDSIRKVDTHTPRRQLYTELGSWLNEHTGAHESVAYFEIGYLGWFSERSIIDPVGLVTPGGLEDISRGRLDWIFEQHAPDFFVHNSLQGAPPLLSSAGFRSRYRAVRNFRKEGYPGELTLFERN